MSFVDEIVTASTAFYKCAMELEKQSQEDLNLVKEAGDKWHKMPKGWKSKSRKDFFKHLAKGKVRKCIDKMKDKVDDPGAFCASLKDRVTGRTNWRGGDKK
jgi:hypothetical protein